MKPRPSDRLDFSLNLFDYEFGRWCELVILLWRADPNLSLEFSSIIEFFDFVNEATDKLIESASQE
jgi:hypothetical protein